MCQTMYDQFFRIDHNIINGKNPIIIKILNSLLNVNYTEIHFLVNQPQVKH